MPISDAVREEVVRLLLQDVRATVGLGHDHIVQAAVESAYLTDANAYVWWVAEDVQSSFHDFHIDTSWPRCPRHLKHPLWLRSHEDGFFWFCDADNVPIARLGELGGPKTR